MGAITIAQHSVKGCAIVGVRRFGKAGKGFSLMLHRYYREAIPRLSLTSNLYADASDSNKYNVLLVLVLCGLLGISHV